jgi:ABC-type antimicrobial peptide transport system permease subunit
MALGARFGPLLWHVMRFAVGLAALGVAVGLALSLWLGYLVGPLLFEVPARDPLVHSLAAVSLLGAAFLASLFPALRIRRIDPAVALRAE